MRYLIVVGSLLFIGCTPEHVATVVGSGVRVRSAPSLQASVLGVARRGETFFVDSVSLDGYSTVEYTDGHTGYVATVYLVMTDPVDARSRYELFMLRAIKAGPAV